MENDTTKMYNDLYFSMIEWFLQKLFDFIICIYDKIMFKQKNL